MLLVTPYGTTAALESLVLSSFSEVLTCGAEANQALPFGVNCFAPRLTCNVVHKLKLDADFSEVFPLGNVPVCLLQVLEPEGLLPLFQRDARAIETGGTYLIDDGSDSRNLERVDRRFELFAVADEDALDSGSRVQDRLGEIFHPISQSSS